MVAVPGNANKKVLVTGANGFIALYTIKDLLDNGYIVRGTIRNEAKGKHILNYFKSYLDKNPQAIELVIVPDIITEGGFDEAVKGVDAILHLATPIANPDPDPEAFAKPAVEGTLSVLKSAAKHGADVKRIVVTSSSGAVRGIPTSFVVYNENDWADIFIDVVKEKGAKAESLEKYRAAKVKAERAAWNFYNENKASLPWDLAVLNPPVTLGPAIQETTTLDKVNESNLVFTKIFLNPQPDHYLANNIALVDVRDVSLAHVLALQKEEAGGERIIICGDDRGHQEILDLVHSIQPTPPWIHKVPRGKPEIVKKPVFTFDNSKSIKLLGLKYHSLEDTIKDTWDDFYQKGWFN